MTDNRPRSPTPAYPFNPFGNTGEAAPTRPAPSCNPFMAAPAPARSMPTALLAAYHSARAEWREYLPHGLAAAAYDTPQPAWLFDLAVQSATTVLTPLLPPAQVAALATALARAALHDTGRELAANEP